MCDEIPVANQPKFLSLDWRKHVVSAFPHPHSLISGSQDQRHRPKLWNWFQTLTDWEGPCQAQIRESNPQDLLLSFFALNAGPEGWCGKELAGKRTPVSPSDTATV